MTRPGKPVNDLPQSRAFALGFFIGATPMSVTVGVPRVGTMSARAWLLASPSDPDAIKAVLKRKRFSLCPMVFAPCGFLETLPP